MRTNNFGTMLKKVEKFTKRNLSESEQQVLFMICCETFAISKHTQNDFIGICTNMYNEKANREIEELEARLVLLKGHSDNTTNEVHNEELQAD